MTIELKPELEQIIRDQLSMGRFQSVDELLATALAQLADKSKSNAAAVQRMLDFTRRHSVKLPVGETVEAIVHESRLHS